MQTKTFRFWPSDGVAIHLRYGSQTAEMFRTDNRTVAWKFNPWTGSTRAESDVASDPFGLLIVPPGEAVQAADSRDCSTLCGDYPNCTRGRARSTEPIERAMSALATQVGGDHYKKLAIQPMEYSMANKLDACQHTVIKYVTRFRDKGGVDDLRKAKHVIDMLIEFEEKANG